jgi:hypothetical protein
MSKLKSCLVLALAFACQWACSNDHGTSPDVEPEPEAHEPWEDDEAENLAWLISGYTWAPRDLYERIRSDLAAIREGWADSTFYADSARGWTVDVLKLCRHYPRSSPGRLVLVTEPETYNRMTAGEYHDWDSLNAALHAEVEFRYEHPYITSSDRVNYYRMATAYERLPGVKTVWPRDGGIGDRSNLYAYQYAWGIAYLFRFGYGDCPSGCICSAYFYFRSNGERLEYVGGWNPCVARDAEPAWWEEAYPCIELYRLGDEEYRARDVTPPATISDLRIVAPQVSRTVSVAFTSPGDDSLAGQALSYSVHWGYEPVTDSNWSIPSYHPEIGGMASFDAHPPGSQVTLTLTTLAGDTINYIAVRAYDGRGNASGISNQVISRNTLLNGWTYYNSTNSNLPDGWINTVFVDRRGNAWAGTKNGAARLADGQWERFTVENSALPSNYVTAIGEDQEGNVWVGTVEGASSFDGTAWIPRVPTGGQSSTPEVRCITPAADGSVWCGVRFEGAARYNGTGWEWFSPDNSGIGGTVVRQIEQASDGTLWFASSEGVSEYDGTSWMVHTPILGMGTNYIYSLLLDQSGILWCGSDEGNLAQFDGTVWLVTEFKSQESHTRHSGAVRNIVRTTNGDVWLDTYGSLRWLPGGNQSHMVRLLPSNSGLPERDIRVLAAGNDNSLWIGTKNAGLCRWNLDAIAVPPLSSSLISSRY